MHANRVTSLGVDSGLFTSFRSGSLKQPYSIAAATLRERLVQSPGGGRRIVRVVVPDTLDYFLAPSTSSPNALQTERYGKEEIQGSQQDGNQTRFTKTVQVMSRYVKEKQKGFCSKRKD